MVGQSIPPTTCVLQKRSVKSSTATYGPECTVIWYGGTNEETILAVKLPQRHSTSRRKAARLNAKLVSAAPPAKHRNCSIKIMAPLPSAMAAFDHRQQDVLLVCFNYETLFEDTVYLALTSNVRRTTEFCVVQMKRSHSSISASSQAAMIAVYSLAYVLFAEKDVQNVETYCLITCNI